MKLMCSKFVIEFFFFKNLLPVATVKALTCEIKRNKDELMWVKAAK